MKRWTWKKGAVAAGAAFLLAAVGFSVINVHSTRAGNEEARASLLSAEELIRTGLNDPETRTEAIWLYEDVLEKVKGDDAESRNLLARAHLGLGVINLFDFFDLLPALSSFLGIDLLDLFNPGGGAAAASAGATLCSAALVQPLQSCTPVDFEDYLYFLDQMLTNMIYPTVEHFQKARELDPSATLALENARALLVPDDPATPEDDSLALDLSGEWDQTDMAFFQGALELMLGGLKLLLSYDGILQSMINPAITPDCTPVPGSEEWTNLFGPYNLIVSDGGEERMNQAGSFLAAGFYDLEDALNLLAGETGEQADDLIRYFDCGSDGLCPGDTGYAAPDGDGTEGNGVYDVGEPWGLESAGALISDLLGGLLGASLPVSMTDLSKLLPPPVLAGVMDALGQSVENDTPVDLIPTLLKPLFSALGGGGMTDQQLYALGLPAINLGAWFGPPIQDLSVIEPLKDSAGAPILEVESADTTHAWPDGSGRVDDKNGVVDPGYVFYMDVDENGAPVGVWGGLLLKPVTEPSDFDGDGNLVGEVEYAPMMNPEFNALLTNLSALLP